GNGDTVYEHKVGEELRKNPGASTAQKNTIRQTAMNDVYGGMDAKTWAKQENTMNKINSGGHYDIVKDEVDQKLDRSNFARDIQKHANTTVYGQMQGVNSTHI
ncbi:MAG: hypothetical protein U9Q12_01270, partial [Patescibacteria group bacterium]|nr:hypothetical protein [Patescibacteria group bacterium]